MSSLTYNQLINQTLNHYLNGDYKEAYTTITEKASLVTGNEAQVYNFRYSIACKLGDTELALNLFKEAILEKGFWYACSYLKEDDDLEALRSSPEFEALYEICHAREAKSRESVKSSLLVLSPEHQEVSATKQILIALHGNQENALLTKPYWSEALNHGITLVLPQSSQIEFSDAYCWDDLEKSTLELASLFNQLMEEMPVPIENRMIGGFSAGARTALSAVITSAVEVDKLILVSPWLPEIDTLEDELEKLKAMDVKLYVFAGSLDEDCLEGSLKLVKWLDANEIPHEFTLVPGLDHDYPEDFSQSLIDVIKDEKLAIGRPKPSDREQIYALFETVLKDTYAKNGLDAFKDELLEEIALKKSFLEQDFESDGAEKYFLIAKIKDRVVGTVEFGPANSVIKACNDDSMMTLNEIGTVFVLPDFQAMGIGSAMLGAIEETLVKKGQQAYCLDSGYPSAQKIWLRKLGDPAHVLKDYWGEGFDHMIWRVDL